MEEIIYIIIFILILTIVGATIYMIFDFIDYKNNVDRSFDISTGHVNDNFSKMSKNMEASSTEISENKYNILQNRTDVRNLKRDIDNLSEKTEDMRSQIKESDDTNISSFDGALKQYFSFTDNGDPIQSLPIYRHAFSGIDPSLGLLTHTTTYDGMTINTGENVVNNDNLKICNSDRSCINLNANSDGFNITPDDTNNMNMTINSKNNQPIAKFDMNTNSIYLGGSDATSPLYIENGNVYMHNVNMSAIEDVMNDVEGLKNFTSNVDYNSLINVPEYWNVFDGTYGSLSGLPSASTL